MSTETITLTFGNRGENHAGMQVIGHKLDSGLTTEDLNAAYTFFTGRGGECLMYELRDLLPEARRTSAPSARLLVVKRGADVLLGPGSADALLAEQSGLTRDKQAYMRGRVVNKHARHNLCFADFSQTADFAQKKGTVVNFTQVPWLARLRAILPETSPSSKLRELICEANYYYDVRKTYIGWHGDAEREVVVALRLGADFPLYYRWYEQHKTLGDVFCTTLSHGDLYMMSDKAVGHDWKCSSFPTLRHAAGPADRILGA